MTIVVDASVAAKWFLEEPDSPAAESLLEDPQETLIAPELVVAELSNILWLRSRTKELTVDAAQRHAARLNDFFDELVPVLVLAPRAVALAVELGHPAYDCFYLALAEQRSATLITADKRFYAAVQGTSWGRRIGLLS